MQKKSRKVGIWILAVLIFLVVFKLGAKTFYSVYPTVYKDYVQREDYQENLSAGIEMLEPPAGGCNSTCFGKEQIINCKNYSRKFKSCEFSCRGYLHNTCKGTASLVWGLLVK